MDPLTIAGLLLLAGGVMLPKTPHFTFRPVDDSFPVGSPFGTRGKGFHNGLDFTCPRGTPCRSIGSGIVAQIQSVPAGASGKFVIVNGRDGDSDFTWSYSHLDVIDVRVGDFVGAGDRIGETGNTGDVEPKPTPENPNAGAHLHFVLKRRDGSGRFVTIDPAPHLPARSGAREAPQTT